MDPKSYVAFVGNSRIAHGTLAEVAAAAKAYADACDATGPAALVFDAETSDTVEIDLRGTADEVRARLASPDEPAAPRAPGRPKLGVVAREVTLLPRHWEWLAAQPGGASVTLRKLVEAARRDGSAAESCRRSQDATYRFAVAIAGNEPGFEEATRALYANNAEAFAEQTAAWPADVREHARALAARAFSASEG